MSTFERILVATDLSSESENMLTAAVRLLRPLRAVVDLAHLWRQPAPSVGEGGVLARDEVTFELERAASLLSARGVRTGRELLVDGDIAQLLRLIDEHRYDLVLVGARQHYFHSVAAALQRQAACPVLTMPPEPRARENLSQMRILVAVDFSSASISAANLAAQLGRELDAPLTLLHVYSPPIHVLPDGSSFPAAGDSVKAVIDAAEGELAMLRHRLAFDKVCVETAIVGGNPAESLVEAAAEYDLLVMGTHGRDGLKRLVLGSVAEQVSRRVAVPVITVREDSRGESSAALSAPEVGARSAR